jgi:hypothetical protein
MKPNPQAGFRPDFLWLRAAKLCLFFMASHGPAVKISLRKKQYTAITGAQKMILNRTHAYIANNYTLKT